MKTKTTRDPLYARVRQILESATSHVARSVNTTQVIANWLIGREIVEEEQRGHWRAGYGQAVLSDLSRKLRRSFGSGYSVDNLELFRRFYREYGSLIHRPAIRGFAAESKSDALRRKLLKDSAASRSEPIGELAIIQNSDALRRKSWKPGLLHSNLSWTHYRTLLRADKADARSFYEIEAIKNVWSARELERQVNSLLYERLALSRDKKGVLRLAKKGQEVQKPTDIFKDPVVMEFLGLPKSSRLVESDLEQALINNLQVFLLELGTGFAFVSRQERLTLDGDHFYIDLVFYHTVLKCFVLLELKVGKLTHQDLGQIQLYINYFDRERLSPGDNPTLGLILCTDKNDAVVKYTLAEGQRKVFASRYKLHVPSEAELKAEIRRELRILRAREGR